MNFTATRTRWLLIGAVALFVLIAGLWGVQRARPVTEADVEETLIQSILQGDAAAFRAVVDPRELTLNPMSDAQLSRFLKTEIAPYLVAAQRDRNASGAKAQRLTIRKGTTTRELPLGPTETAQGLRVAQPFTTMFLAFSSLEAGGAPPKGPDKLKQWRDGGRVIAPRWAEYGVKSIQLSAETDPMTIDHFLDWTGERIARVAARAKP
ncbi:MAG: hypothetical protein SFX74_00335 [Fimbriimonadaceae bacterium]|nr:hypothetical protein [Fimbriimonadaceae bacterium]